MKAPNGKSVLANRATVSILASVYDRRGLDSTCDRSLVNSLNHLTFLTSSSIKVRDAMVVDGAIERLVGILYECRNPETKESEALCAWKWVLSLQCLVLAGTRGSEKMRAKLVHAGIVPVLATILDNHFLERKHVINAASTTTTSTTSMSNSNTNTNTNVNPNANVNTNTITNTNQTNNTIPHLIQPQQDPPENGFDFSVHSLLLQRSQNTIMEIEDMLKRDQTPPELQNDGSDTKTLDDETKRLLKKVEYIRFLEQLLTVDDPSRLDPMMSSSFKEFSNDELFGKELNSKLEISNILLGEGSDRSLSLKVCQDLNESFNVPRSFENGLIVPTSDDVIWCLQLLAFISKYTYLRHLLSNTYVITGLSCRSQNSPPPLEVDGLDIDEFMSDQGDERDDNDDDLDEPLKEPEIFQNFDNRNLKRLCNLKSNSPNGHLLVDDLLSYLKSDNNLQKSKLEVKIDLNYTRIKHETFGKYRLLNRKKYQEKKKNYKMKWNYDESWDEIERDVGESNLVDKDIQPYLTLNIFPLVERFTVKDWFSDDICYWAAVVVRNANRKDETMGGRRQCANFSCGKWEDHPKQFSKCRRCKRAKYCSKECQTKAWVFHKHWCVPAPSNLDGSSLNQNPNTSNNNNASNFPSRSETPQN